MIDLRRVFNGVGWKRLAAVEVDPTRSRQHELNGVAAFQAVLGTDRVDQMPTRFLYLGDGEDDIWSEDGSVTWYDAREAHPTRSEYRLYYYANNVTVSMKAGDLLILATTDDVLLWIVCPNGSTAEAQMMWLFELEAEKGSAARAKPIPSGDHRSVLAVRAALESLGVGFDGVQDEPSADWVNAEFDAWMGRGFPSTAALSAFARNSIAGIAQMQRDDPDGAILACLEREEEVFRALEKGQVERRLETGFNSVDDFVSYSLSVQNRRKSRAGHAFEHHLAAIFDVHGLRYDAGARTENKAKPDFLFPGEAEYHRADYPAASLDLLGAKTTCKDRWRQVLSEGARVERKHLVTIEAAISTSQTDEMEANHLQLVVPRGIRSTYTAAQREWLMTLEGFIDHRRIRDDGDSVGKGIKSLC